MVSFLKIVVATAVGMFIAISAVLMIGSASHTAAVPRAEMTPTSDDNGCYATREKFDRIISPAHLLQVEKIMGCKGEKTDETTLPGSNPWRTYIWRGRKDGTGFVGIFQGSTLKSYHQVGL